jgi:hypothetical protein
MSRFGWRRRPRRGGWRRTATAADSHPIAVRAVPHRVVESVGDSRLSEGAVVEASVLARVLGIKLLTLEGTVVLTPAEVRDVEPVAESRPARRPTVGNDVAASRLRAVEIPAGAGTAAGSAAAGRGIGARLATAERLLADCSKTIGALTPPHSPNDSRSGLS